MLHTVACGQAQSGTVITSRRAALRYAPYILRQAICGEHATQALSTAVRVSNMEGMRMEKVKAEAKGAAT